MRPQNTLFLLVLLVVFSSAVLAEQTNPNDAQTSLTPFANRPVDPGSAPYFLNVYPEFEGYIVTSQSRRGDVERVDYQNGEIGLPDSSSVVFNNQVILDSFVFPQILENTLSLWPGYETVEMNGEGPFYQAERMDFETKFNFLMWVSGNRLVSITFVGSYPQSIIDKYLELLSLEPYPFPEPESKYSNQEKMNLLYTSDAFENPPDYLAIILKSRAGSAPCVLVGPDAKPASTDAERIGVIRQILSQKQQTASASEIETMVQECRETGNFTVRGEPIPYDIRACVRELMDNLIKENIFFNEVDIKQECLIETYSKEKFIESVKSIDEYNSKVVERREKVKELIRQRHAPIEECIENAETNEIIKCEIRGGGVIQLDTLPIEVSVPVLDGSETKILVIRSNGSEEFLSMTGIAVSVPIEVVIRDSKVVVGDTSIDILPDEILEKLPDKAVIVNAEIVSQNNNLTYNVRASVPSNLLFVFPIEIPISAEIDAKSGETTIHKPWWGFLIIQ